MRTLEGWPYRRSIRLKGFDYSRPGAYFVTITIQQRLSLLGAIRAGRVQLSEAGRMVSEVWSLLPEHYVGVTLDAFIIMPDHIHGIIVLGANNVRPTIALPDVVHRFKSLSTARYRWAVYREGWPPFPGRFWHRNYYERIIRSEAALRAVRRYIADNPRRWRISD